MRRLPRAEIEELIHAYRDGASTTALAERYRISQSAVLGLLQRHNVPRRFQPLTDADIDRVEQLYLQGHSFIACAKLTGLPATTINRALHKRGTPIRRKGRPRVTAERTKSIPNT
ncbi:hypothetical protein HLB23_09175 [Nocardia uniformis]|uniref:Uncharacterized protein n=1 Tax=Nocardia uniformis TaxID=53432 RepID=A0A849BTT3_9NOCA|nr:hypothetical protein [Nocardia uniformis]NNH70032.1 hypothetical protein [Nocardia uniformis]